MPRKHLLTLIALVLIGTIISVLLQSNRPVWRDTTGSSAAARIGENRTSPELVVGEGELTVVVFTDYQCPPCRKAAPELRRAAERDGNVRLVFKDWPIFGERSERAAMIALAARNQQSYLAVHDKLMSARSFTDEAIRVDAEMAGADWAQLRSDLAVRGEAIARQLAANRTDALALGLRGTPGYLIGPLIVEGALTEREFLRAFNAARSGR